MATLIVADRQTLPAAPVPQRLTTLLDWLDDQWAVLFSHPEDFAPHPSTPAGFITLLAEDFAEYGVKPLVLADASNSASWLEYAGADASTVVLDDGQADAQVVDLAEHSLLSKLNRMDSPFVMVIDANGRCRSTITYRARRDNGPRTIYDVLAVVQMLQRGSNVTPEHYEQAIAG